MKNCDLVVEVLSGNAIQTCSFRIIILDGVSVPKASAETVEKSREMLEALVLNRKIYYEERGKDEYGRIIARVEAEGKSVNDAMAAFAEKESNSARK